MSVDIDGNGAELSVEDEDGNIAFSQRIAVAHRKSNYAPRQPILNLEVAGGVPRRRDLEVTSGGTRASTLVLDALENIVSGAARSQFGYSMRATRKTGRHAPTRIHEILDGEVELRVIEKHCRAAALKSGMYHEVPGKDKNRNNVTEDADPQAAGKSGHSRKHKQ